MWHQIRQVLNTNWLLNKALGSPAQQKPERKSNIQNMISNRVYFLRETVFPKLSLFFRYEKNTNKICFSGKSDVTFIINFQLKFSF